MYKEDTMKRVAHLISWNVPHTAIMQSLNLTQNAFDEILQDEFYLSFVSSLVVARMEQQASVKEGWEAAEEQALCKVLKSLEFSADPDYALRVAQIANKAIEGETRERKQLDGRDTGAAPVTVKLNVNFVQTVKDGITVSDNSEIPQKKISEAPAPALIENLLTSTEKKNEVRQFEELLEDVDFAVT